ncbi:MAG: alpha/beta hydrolase [Lachnospiraceae bacterium]|nr:alpha/beta hydrolase [Lachnospiraceae bacterium]
MCWILIFLIIFIILLTGSYYAYRIAFHCGKRWPEDEYVIPEGEQFEAARDIIYQSMKQLRQEPFERVQITSHDGKTLHGKYYHTAPEAPLQIQFHGYRSHPITDFCGGCKLALKLGQNVLLVDQRAHGKSEGAAITFGIEERKDCLDWIQYVRERFGAQIPIILTGISMGAATILMATDLELPSNVKGIIADSPFSAPGDIIRKVCRVDMHLPDKLVYPFIKLGARLFGNFNLEESSAACAVQHTQIPLLLIHGEDDRYVPCSMSRKILAACKGPVTSAFFPGAGHGLSYVADSPRYEALTIEFLENVLK